MRNLFRGACLIAAGLTLANNSDAQQMDGWPEWLIEAMAAESSKLKTAEFAIEAGPYQFTLPKETSGPNAFDGGWYFESQIGSDAVLECYIFTGDNDLATLTNNLVDISLQTTAETNGGNLDNKSVLALDAGHLDGSPYLSVEWVYTVGEAPNALVGHTKVAAATNGKLTQACSHTALGYRETFKNSFATFVRATQQPGPAVEPYYEEVALQKLAGQPIGTVHVSYTLDEDGDTRIDTVNASLIQIGPDSVASSDSVSVSWSTPEGMLINALIVDAENGEVVTNLTLARNDSADWQVSGTFQGKPLEHVIDGSEAPISDLGSIQIARAFFAGDATEVSFPMWISDADPTRMLQATMQREDKNTAGEALLILGPLSMQTSFDDAGSVTYSSMQIGALEFALERVWHRGTLH